MARKKNKANRKSWAIYVITKHGVAIARKLRDQLDDADIYVTHKFENQLQMDRVYLLSMPMGETIHATFNQYNAHIHIMSIGVVVRMIAPLLRNKKNDPAIICVDDKAQFTIPVLSGHVGRGNEFANKISQILENTPVITTASDVGQTFTVDILGRELGWILDDTDRNVTRACAAVVNQENVLFVQETGEKNFWPDEKKLPSGVEYATSLDGISVGDFSVFLIATDRDIKRLFPDIYEHAVIYRPKSLVLGMGCDRDTPLEIVEHGIRKVLEENHLEFRCIKGFSTIDIKADEEAFLRLKEKYAWDFTSYRADELDAVKNIPTPSVTVKNYVGTHGVAEPSAMLSAGTNELIVPKQIYKEEGCKKNVTIAIARIPFPLRISREIQTVV
ncbi:cobalamin biosynthesis protein [Candidatus Scalindua japonica]|uniref:Cobalamin biosynthesis protein n=1 Tax=Candidatus Scalindua japonica TaxID=1284222 RepID=A0A286U0K9_9BACT|nr:cobalamin biosynthesis protein [Candidatus Scalindua japonica]GAX61601.1 cobalamin biosynthesis protein [Candidatus Scalindua japonica]